MKALVIYDDTGRIWTIMYGEERVPQGLQCMWVDIPDGARLDHIDVTNAGNPQPVFAYLPESDIGRLQEQVVSLGIWISSIYGCGMFCEIIGKRGYNSSSHRRQG